MSPMKRRHLLQTGALAGLGTLSANSPRKQPLLGQGEFRYRVVPEWGVLDAKTPVNDCPGIVADAEGHIILLTNDTTNNVIVYDKDGRLVHKWGTEFPGAHGLSIIREDNREVLFITDLNRHLVCKTTLDGTILDQWGWPEKSGKYQNAKQYRPSWTLHAPDGDFFVLDGYGRDYIQHFDSAGKRKNVFGGQEGGIAHWGPHGGIHDENSLLIAMSDQQYLLKLDESGKELQRVSLPGGNPRQIQRRGDYYFIPHLADNWPKDRNSRGFVSILDLNFKVLANLAGSPPEYNEDGKLRKMKSLGETFLHPHDLVVDREQSIYVAQFASGKTYPIKLERV